MNDRDLRRSERATRVQTFGTDYAGDILAGSKAAALFTELDGILQELIPARIGQLRTPVTKETLLGRAQSVITRLDAGIQNKYSRNPDRLTA